MTATATRAVRLTLPAPPSANDYWRSITVDGRARVLVSREAREYKDKVRAICADAGVRPFAGAVRVDLEWYRARKSGDLDNRLKVVLDALRGIAYTDDAQVVEIRAARDDDKHNPRLEVVVYGAEAGA